MRSKNIQSDGSGNGADSDFINRVLGHLRELQFYDSQTIKVEQTTRGTRFHAKPPSPAGISGIHYQTPNKELDPTISVSKNTLVYLSPQNPLCQVGLKDLQTGTILMATAGQWLCVQDCPAATVAGYNVPQDPFPGYNTSAPSGTPLTGDADAATVFWILQKSAC